MKKIEFSVYYYPTIILMHILAETVNYCFHSSRMILHVQILFILDLISRGTIDLARHCTMALTCYRTRK